MLLEILVNNVHQEPLNPEWIAKGYKMLKDQFNMSQRKIARLVHKSQAHVSHMLKLVELPEETQDLINKISSVTKPEEKQSIGNIVKDRFSFTSTHTRIIASKIKDPLNQKDIILSIGKYGLTTTQTKDLIENMKSKPNVSVDKLAEEISKTKTRGIKISPILVERIEEAINEIAKKHGEQLDFDEFLRECLEQGVKTWQKWWLPPLKLEFVDEGKTYDWLTGEEI